MDNDDIIKYVLDNPLICEKLHSHFLQLQISNATSQVQQQSYSPQLQMYNPNQQISVSFQQQSSTIPVQFPPQNNPQFQQTVYVQQQTPSSSSMPNHPLNDQPYHLPLVYPNNGIQRSSSQIQFFHIIQNGPILPRQDSVDFDMIDQVKSIIR